SEVAGAFEGRQRRAIDLQAALMSTLQDLAMSGDEIGGTRRGIRPGLANVVDAFEHDNVRYARLCQNVAVQSHEGARASPIIENAIAADTCINHAQANPR